MRWIKLFEDFKNNNIEGTLITIEDIIKCIKSDGVIYSSAIKDYKDNDPEVAVKPLSIDEDGLITVDIEGSEYSVSIENVEKVEF